MQYQHFAAGFSAAVFSVSFLAAGAAAAPTDSNWQASNYHFASQAEGAEVLGTSDFYTQHLSAFDRSARLKSEAPVTEAEYLDFARRQALEWTEPEKARLQKAIDAIIPSLQKFKVPSVDIAIVGTTGNEDGRTAFTRQQFIAIPKFKLTKYDDAILRFVIAHETFHIISRTHPELREQLYAVLGYAKGEEALLSEDMRERRLTNPDGPVNDHWIRIEYDGDPVCAAPVTYSTKSHYSKKKGGEFFAYMEQRYVLGWQGAGNEDYKNTADPELVEEDDLDGLFEQIGRNTNYTMHPDETLADNFMFLITGQGKIKDPQILTKMAAVFAGAPDAQKPLLAADICK